MFPQESRIALDEICSEAPVRDQHLGDTPGFDFLQGKSSLDLARIYVRCPLAPRGRQMAQEYHDRPELVVAQDSLRARHAGGFDAIVENPLQLSVCITLHLM